MKNILFIIIIGAFIISCKKPKEKDFEKNIINESSFWSLKALSNNKVEFLGQNFIFKKDKTYIYYQSFTEAHIGSEIFDLHTKEVTKWDFKNNELRLEGNDLHLIFKVINYTTDTIWLNNSNFNYILIRKSHY